MINAKTLQRAIEFAAQAHKGAFRKGDGRPYIMHPISVMTKMQRIKDSSNSYLLAAASVLHDTVEDCGVELETIAREFGHAVASLVEELTLDKEKYATIGKTKYLCQEMTKMSSYALCIKLCDRWDNLEDMKLMPREFIDRYVQETRDILDYVLTNRTNLTATHKLLMSEIIKILNKY